MNSYSCLAFCKNMQLLNTTSCKFENIIVDAICHNLWCCKSESVVTSSLLLFCISCCCRGGEHLKEQQVQTLPVRSVGTNCWNKITISYAPKPSMVQCGNQGHVRLQHKKRVVLWCCYWRFQHLVQHHRHNV